MASGAQQALGWALACAGAFIVYDAYRGVNPLTDLEAIVSGVTRPAKPAEPASFTMALPTLTEGTASTPTTTTTTTTGTAQSTSLTITGDPTGKRAIICQFALDKVGGQYVYGGNGPTEYDCSGLFTAAYKAAGLTVPRTSGVESVECQATTSPQPGDAVFYGHPAEHVGVYLGGGQMVAADHPNAGGPGVGILHEAVYPFNGGAGGPAAWYGSMNVLRAAEKAAGVSI